MKDQQEAEQYVQQRLEEIRDVPPRNPHMASRGRAQFLSQAVSAALLPRQKGWSFKFRKEQYAMNVLLSILLIAGVLFGGGATVVGAAQDDLPGEPLYAVKTWSEDVGLQMQYDPQAKVERLMELAQIRIQEMSQLVENGQPVPDQVRLRLEQHIRQALQLCAQMDDPAMERALLQIRERLQLQLQETNQLQVRTQQEQALPAAQQQMQIMNQTQTMLQQRLEVVDEGLQNREMFREQAQNGFQVGQEEVTPPAQNGGGQQNGQPEAGPNEPSPAPDESGNPSPSPSPNPAPGDNGGNGNGSGGGGKP
ncbi:MAG: hypothetical protein HRF47_00855 [Chloroflexota bacterium]|jgi:hypothetical protein